MIRSLILKLPRSIRDRLLKILIDEFLTRKSERAGIRSFFGTDLVLRNLKEKGFNPQKVIDCGAYNGSWTRMVKDIFPEAKILMVEANPERESELKKVQSELSGAVELSLSLAGPINQKDISFYSMENGSSIYAEQSNIPRKKIVLPMRQLDEIAQEKEMLPVDFLKLDVQGYELEVLKGAGQLLLQAQFILLETSLVQYNENAPRFDEVVAFMKSNGFVLYDAGEMIRWSSDNTLIQMDLIFTKSESLFRPTYFNFK